MIPIYISQASEFRNFMEDSLSLTVNCRSGYPQLPFKQNLYEWERNRSYFEILTMTSAEQIHTLLPLIILLLVGVFAIALMRPLRLSPIVGYLIAGVFIGPYGMGLIRESETTHLLAELGVVFLLFDIGLHFSLGHMWDVRRDILGLGPLQVTLSAIALGGFGLLAGLELPLAVVLGIALALSSTAVAIQTIAEYDQQSCPIGANATAVLIFQDICAIFLLILANSLGGSGGSLGAALGSAGIKAAAAFAAAIFIGRFLIRPLFKLVSKLRNEEVFTAVALLVVLVTGAATGWLGLSLTLGAFLGGMIISETPYRYLIQAEVKPFRGLLLGFFFITIGMVIDTNVIIQKWPQILLGVVVLLSLKTVLTFLAALIVRAPVQNAIQLGFLLSQGSEFAFVVFGVPAVQGALGGERSSVLIAIVAASMAMTPPLAALGHRIATQRACKDWETQHSEPAVAIHGVPPVLLFGMGELGRRVADALESHSIGYTAIEKDYDHFVRANADGYPVAFGDAADPRLMETLKVSQRLTVVITVIRYEVSRDLTPIVQERYPNLRRIIAVQDEDQKAQFEALGMMAIVSRSVPRGLDLAAAVLRVHGVEEASIRHWVERHQEQALEEAAAVGVS